MFEYNCLDLPEGVLGMMPCGELKYFNSEDEYKNAYHNEENEIADQLAELYDRMGMDDIPEYPEDYNFLVA